MRINPLNLVLRLAIWFLLTSDLSLVNIVIGVTIALILPQGRVQKETLKEWIDILVKIVAAIPIAYKEAIEIIFRPHNREEILRERVKPARTPGLIFLDIFLITFTPKTIVVRYDQNGWYQVHWVKR
ncbi:MAG: cation:proton antiporter [Gloeocapsa sp. DLM2.Bin57]|nr:MAG: cation:proton antiporter [Gloeocapsa sp. DLM2.Bin57]